MARQVRPPRELDKYLLIGERVLVIDHQHWTRVAEPIGSAVAALVLVAWADQNTSAPASSVNLVDLLWWVFFAVLLRTLWKVLQWQNDWFVVTDKRLLLYRGLFNRDVPMMPLSKVTDMSYRRSVPGRIMGYGKFVMESAGQDQALREVHWVRNPDYCYHVICTEIFGLSDADDGTGPIEDPYAARHGRGRGGPMAPAGLGEPPPLDEPPDPVRRGQVIRDGDDRSTAIRVRRRGEDSSIYRSPDLADDREADTGPIPIYPPDDWRS